MSSFFPSELDEFYAVYLKLKWKLKTFCSYSLFGYTVGSTASAVSVNDTSDQDSGS